MGYDICGESLSVARSGIRDPISVKMHVCIVVYTPRGHVEDNALPVGDGKDGTCMCWLWRLHFQFAYGLAIRRATPYRDQAADEFDVVNL